MTATSSDWPLLTFSFLSSLITLHKILVKAARLAVMTLKEGFAPALEESALVKDETMPGNTFFKASSSVIPLIRLSKAFKAASRTLSEGPSDTPSSITVTV